MLLGAGFGAIVKVYEAELSQVHKDHTSILEYFPLSASALPVIDKHDPAVQGGNRQPSLLAG